MPLDATLSQLAQQWPSMPEGHVWLAGAGPGDPRHLTLEVVMAIGQADAIVHDALISDAVLALGASAEKYFVGKRGSKPSTAQDDIFDLLVDLARQGKRVLRLKGGDPFLFGRGGEEALHLKAHGIPFRVLPGLTSAFAALASAHIPATMRGINRAISFATGHIAALGEEQPDDLDWAALAQTREPIVIYMGMKNLAGIADKLMQSGRSPIEPAAIIMAASTPDERVLIATLATIADAALAEGFASPSLIVIGDIVTMRQRLLEE